MEKPLKLVLKVAGNEVTELSTGSSGHDDHDKDKHRDKKKKKKKKGDRERSSPVPSIDDKRKKKVPNVFLSPCRLRPGCTWCLPPGSLMKPAVSELPLIDS